ncbi:hypothetical protein [Blastopirellula marina]|uniref:Uncharacterized protein n=1 Tax=Blastopirellula marina TaxID=124 RepID=A0A2S8F4Z6_9BACT|nr:hypothetical protein [Blastopirellula marina]PQO27242.1 hypothetical protein C5Y98_28815 [Blastopirellula marina]PTL41388.1 hypothetical protein C5Y97_28830 [Blastopirellula marina]
MKINKPALRSAQFQVSLMAGAIIGAVVLAIAAILVREIFFEKYVREPFVPVHPSVSQRAEALLITPLPAATTPLTADEVDGLYTIWIQNQEFDPQGELAAQLFVVDSEHTFERCCRTLVIGNYEQRSRALRLLSYANLTEHPVEVRRLVTYARQKSARRSENDLVTKADELLARLPQGKTP